MNCLNYKIISYFILIFSLFFISEVTGFAQPKTPPPAPPIVVNDQPIPINPKAEIQAAQTLYSIGDPTAEEQLILEFINRARADANAEAQRLANTTDEDVLNAIDFFGVDLDVMINQFSTLV